MASPVENTPDSSQQGDAYNQRNVSDERTRG